MRKIAKLRKFFLSFKKSLSSLYNFNNLYKCYIFDVKSLYRLFSHLFEMTGKLNEAWFTQKNFQKKTFILAAILGKPTKLSKGYRNLSGNPKKPPKTRILRNITNENGFILLSEHIIIFKAIF